MTCLSAWLYLPHVSTEVEALTDLGQSQLFFPSPARNAGSTLQPLLGMLGSCHEVLQLISLASVHNNPFREVPVSSSTCQTKVLVSPACPKIIDVAPIPGSPAPVCGAIPNSVAISGWRHRPTDALADAVPFFFICWWHDVNGESNQAGLAGRLREYYFMNPPVKCKSRIDGRDRTFPPPVRQWCFPGSSPKLHASFCFSNGTTMQFASTIFCLARCARCRIFTEFKLR